jgi:hypothetical protein
MLLEENVRFTTIDQSPYPSFLRDCYSDPIAGYDSYAHSGPKWPMR